MESQYLDYSRLPAYFHCGFRQFEAGEEHIHRIADFDVLLLILSGALSFTEDHLVRTVPAGRWYIQRRGRRQGPASMNEAPRYFYIHFGGEYVHSAIHSLPMEGTFAPALFLPLFQELWLKESSNAAMVEKCALFYRILTDLYLAYASARQGLVAAARAEMAANLSNGINVQQLAERYGYTANHFIRLFKQKLGETPHQALTNLRLQRAMQLLLAGVPQKEVAEQCGFQDTTSLYRIFKAQMNLSPAQWLKQQQLQY